MKLGIDLDGVVVDFVGACADILGYYKAEDVKQWDDVFALANMTASEFFGAVRSFEVFDQALPCAGAVDALNKLRRAGHDIHFVTARPEWAVGHTRDWISHYFGKTIGQELHILSNGESKADVPCDIYLDDAPHVLTDLMNRACVVVRYERPWNTDCKDWDHSVANWEQFVALVERLSDTAHTACGKCTKLYSNCLCAYREGDDHTVDSWDRRRLAKDFHIVVDPDTGGMKGQKAQQPSLLPWDALMKVSEHYTAGAYKYSRDNWTKGYAWHLTFDALQRHLAKWWQGEDLDEEGLDHLNAVVFHALALRTFTLRNIGTDDRP